jgi:ribosome-binding factor A
MEKVGDLIRTELADIILRKLKDPRVGFVTITHVEVSPDLRHARVLISVLGSDEQKKDTMKGLKSAAPFMRVELGKRMKLRVTPELAFTFDESIERGAHMLELLESIKKEHKDGEGEE